MTTPTYVNSAYRVIDNAMHEAKLIEEGQEPNSEQLAKNMIRLNDMINMAQTQGLKLWLQQDLSIAAPVLQAGVRTYTLGPSGNVPMVKPTRVIEGYYQDQNLVNRPLNLLSRNEWNSLSSYNTQGQVSSFFPDKQAFSLIVNLWLTPDAVAAQGSVHLVIQQQQSGAISLTDNMVFPVEWFLYLVWGLADQICGGQPQAIMDRCMARAESYRTKLEEWDVEDASTTFQPDSRQGGYGNRFS